MPMNPTDVVPETYPYVERFDHGLVVYSEVPFIEPRWWDKTIPHFVWSYASWLSMIAEALGWDWPRRWFKTWGWR